MTERQKHTIAAQRLRDHVPVVLRLWEDRVREAIPAARHQDRLVLFDEIPLFLARLVQMLTGELDSDEACAADEVCKEHGEQREGADYRLNAVVLEYRILRKTICEVLEAEAALDPDSREAITDFIELAMQQAAERFVEVHDEILQNRIDALSEANTHKNQFVATLAHELRTPLSAISNAVYILENVQLDDRAIRQLSTVSRQARTLGRLVDDMMDISRISLGKIELRREMVLLARLAESAGEGVLPLIEARGQDLQITLPSEQLFVEVDPVRLEQVITNLLNNAIKYTEPGGSIWLTVEREGLEAVVRVKDTGIGIDPVVLPQIFDLFVQVDPAAVRSRSGLGIGLALVKRLVELHGGTVSAHSSGEQQGTEFTVRLPMVQP